MNDLHNIPSNNEETFSNEELLDYINNNLAPEEQHHLEKNIEQDPFMFDAIEGLQGISDKAQITTSINELNQHLSKLVNTKNKRKQKRKLPFNQWAMLAVVVVLFVSIITYFIIHLQLVK